VPTIDVDQPNAASFRKIAPLAAGAQDIYDPVHDRAYEPAYLRIDDNLLVNCFFYEQYLRKARIVGKIEWGPMKPVAEKRAVEMSANRLALHVAQRAGLGFIRQTSIAHPAIGLVLIFKFDSLIRSLMGLGFRSVQAPRCCG
jgi:hypothetical protein